jgi:SecD/SecF fusion protein
VVTKLIFALMVRFNLIKTLSMMALIKPTNIDWISKRKIAAAVSLVVILGSWGFLLFKSQTAPTQVFGVDFTGGTSITLNVEKKVPVETVRQTLAAAGLKDCNIQYQQEMEVGGDTYLQVQTVHEKVDGKKTTDVVVGALKATHADAQFSLAQDDVVGGIIGKELKKNAVVAVALSLVIIIIYLAIRFEFGFALGAIVAVFHDALVVVGVYVLLGRQLNMTIVAAVLTIIGYSVNDTIVIFDRIREDLKVVRAKTFVEICNQALNETLARTILTSGITFITVLMLLLFGGGAILDLALALTIGMIAGTYSTIYIATPVVLAWHRGRKPSFAVQPT